MRYLDKHSSAIIGIVAALCFQSGIKSPCAPSIDDPTSLAIAKAKSKDLPNSKIALSELKSGKDKDWQKDSDQTARHYKELSAEQREQIYSDIIPRAKEQAPNSTEFGILLARYATALLDNKKFDQAVNNFDNALKVMRSAPDSERRRRAMAQTLGAEGSALFKLKQFDKSEFFLRQAIAYVIAYPNIRKKFDLRKTYQLLKLNLEYQNKKEEADMLAQLITNMA